MVCFFSAVMGCKMQTIRCDNVGEPYPWQSKYSPCSITAVGLERWVMRNDACCYLVTESSFVFVTNSVLQQPSNALSLCEQTRDVAHQLAISKEGPEHSVKSSISDTFSILPRHPVCAQGVGKQPKSWKNRLLAIFHQPQAQELSF